MMKFSKINQRETKKVQECASVLCS